MDRSIERASKLDTATISDALDRAGIVGQCYGIKPRDPKFRMVGRAYTILYGPASSPPGTVGDFIDDVAPGSVIVLDNGGRDDVTVWGDILTEIAHRRKISGTAIDGICRDVALCTELNYPVYAKDHWMRTGKDRVEVRAAEVTVTLGRVRVTPGDIVRGDADGTIVIPKRHEDKILSIAEEIATAEERIRAAIRDGLRLDEARKAFNYHSLQSREKP